MVSDLPATVALAVWTTNPLALAGVAVAVGATVLVGTGVFVGTDVLVAAGVLAVVVPQAARSRPATRHALNSAVRLEKKCIQSSYVTWQAICQGAFNGYSTCGRVL